MGQSSQLLRISWDDGIKESDLTQIREELRKSGGGSQGVRERSLSSPSGALTREDRPNPAGKCKKPI